MGFQTFKDGADGSSAHPGRGGVERGQAAAADVCVFGVRAFIFNSRALRSQMVNRQ